MSDKNDNITHILNRFGPSKPTKPASEQEPNSGGLIPYQAADIERTNDRAIRLRINYSNGEIELMSYAYMTSALSGTENGIGLMFTTGVVYLEGPNIRTLLDDFQEERVRTLTCFDPKRHEMPEEGKPIIHIIEWRRVDQVLAGEESEEA